MRYLLRHIPGHRIWDLFFPNSQAGETCEMTDVLLLAVSCRLKIIILPAIQTAVSYTNSHKQTITAMPVEAYRRYEAGCGEYSPHPETLLP